MNTHTYTHTKTHQHACGEASFKTTWARKVPGTKFSLCDSADEPELHCLPTLARYAQFIVLVKFQHLHRSCYMSDYGYIWSPQTEYITDSNRFTYNIAPGISTCEQIFFDDSTGELFFQNYTGFVTFMSQLKE